MIGKVTRGWNVYGLISYLMGPGSTEKSAHTDQHVFATWDGCAELHQPERLGHDRFEIGGLVKALRISAALARIPKRRPRPDEWPGPAGRIPKGPVWQCSLRNHPDDPVLTDEQWVDVVADVLHRTGIAERDDPGGCRWVAIRHAPDHVHIAAVLVRQDTGALVQPHHNYDFRRVKEACNAAEERYGLTSTGAADRTATPRPTRAESEKATRLHQSGRRRTDIAVRDRLRRQVASAAAAATSWDEFVVHLASTSATIRIRRGRHRQVIGYSVTDKNDPACRTASGDQLYFAGGKLAPDLTYSKLGDRWASTVAAVPGTVQGIVDDVVMPARDRFRLRGPLAGTPLDRSALQGIAHAAGDMVLGLTAIADAADVPLLTQAWETYARAGRVPEKVLPHRWVKISRELRTAANYLIRSGIRRPQNQRATVADFMMLLVAVAALVAEVAAWHETGQHHVAARHARAAHAMLAQVHGQQVDHGQALVPAPSTSVTSRLTTGRPTMPLPGRSSGPPARRRAR